MSPGGASLDQRCLDRHQRARGVGLVALAIHGRRPPRRGTCRACCTVLATSRRRRGSSRPSSFSRWPPPYRAASPCPTGAFSTRHSYTVRSSTHASSSAHGSSSARSSLDARTRHATLQPRVQEREPACIRKYRHGTPHGATGGGRCGGQRTGMRHGMHHGMHLEAYFNLHPHPNPEREPDPNPNPGPYPDLNQASR